MTTLDHLAIETEGQLSPLQARIRELGKKLGAAAYRRDKERRRFDRLRKAQLRCRFQEDRATEEMLDILTELRELRK